MILVWVFVVCVVMVAGLAGAVVFGVSAVQRPRWDKQAVWASAGMVLSGSVASTAVVGLAMVLGRV